MDNSCFEMRNIIGKSHGFYGNPREFSISRLFVRRYLQVQRGITNDTHFDAVGHRWFLYKLSLTSDRLEFFKIFFSQITHVSAASSKFRIFNTDVLPVLHSFLPMFLPM